MGCAWSPKILSQMDDLGCGFSLIGCRSSLGNALLLVFMVFSLGLTVLRCGGLKRSLCEFMGKSRVLGDGFCSKSVCIVGFDWKKKDFACGVSKEMKISSKVNEDHCLEERDEIVRKEEEVEEEEAGEEVCSEDEVFDVIALRKMVKVQRQRANAALRDLEEEWMAAASAAEEAMAMILRLQNEKSSLQIQSTQLQRFAEEKHVHDQEVIQSLQWIVLQHEEERSLLEQQLELCNERLKMYVQDEQQKA